MEKQKAGQDGNEVMSVTCLPKFCTFAISTQPQLSELSAYNVRSATAPVYIAVILTYLAHSLTPNLPIPLFPGGSSAPGNNATLPTVQLLIAYCTALHTASDKELDDGKDQERRHPACLLQKHCTFLAHFPVCGLKKIEWSNPVTEAGISAHTNCSSGSPSTSSPSPTIPPSLRIIQATARLWYPLRMAVR